LFAAGVYGVGLLSINYTISPDAMWAVLAVLFMGMMLWPRVARLLRWPSVEVLRYRVLTRSRWVREVAARTLVNLRQHARQFARRLATRNDFRPGLHLAMGGA
jgi:hypothetical protein